MAKKNEEAMVRLRIVNNDGGITVFSEPVERRLDLYWKIDALLASITMGRIHFMSVLNDLQSDDNGKTVFENKSDISLCIVNLVLLPYGLEVKEDD